MKQSQRTKNRLREHKDHGWVEINRRGGLILFECPCGWLGWLPADEIDLGA